MTAKPYLWEKSPGVFYVRRKGRYFRITAEAGTEDFDRQYWNILKGHTPARTSWRALVEAFRASDRWRELKPRTRADYDKCFAYIVDLNGDRDVARFTARDVVVMLDKNTHRVRFGNYVASVLSVLCEFARVDLGWLKVNPAKGIRKRRVPEERKAPHLVPDDAAVAKWRAEALPLPRLIFELGVGTVQRPGDLGRFRWGDYDGESLRLVQGKTGKPLRLPVTPELKAALDVASWRDATERGLPTVADPILVGPDGAPMKYRYMAALMLAERRRLGLERAFDLHGLRFRGVQELAWAGCSDEEIEAYSGHASKAMVRHYAGEARQIMRARSAAEKRG
ncbi:MAG: tyrosine-type recombinase/integrase [Tabrizicola sp.]